MAKRRVRRAATSITAREHRAYLLELLLRRYDADEDVQSGLMGLLPAAEAADLSHVLPGSRREAPTIAWLLEARRSADDTAPGPTFVRAAEVLAGQFGLDRLGPTGTAYIVGWCDRYLRARDHGSAPPTAYGPDRLSTAKPWYEFEPELYGVIDPPWDREEWSPMLETRGDAAARLRARALRHITESLRRIERESADRGLVHPRPTANLDRDVGWLFAKMRRGRPIAEIYQDIQPPPDFGEETVRTAIRRLARVIGVSTSGWEAGWR